MGTNARGDVVRTVKGVIQPLHQIVRSNKFLEDDEAHLISSDEEEEEEVGLPLPLSGVEGEEEPDWEGIVSDEEEEGESFEGVEEEDETETPLQWDDLFDQAVGEAENGSDDEEEKDQDQEGNTSIVSVAPSTSSIQSKKRSPSPPLHFLLSPFTDSCVCSHRFRGRKCRDSET